MSAMMGAEPPCDRCDAATTVRALRAGTGSLATLRIMVANPIEAIPRAAYHDGCVPTRLLGRPLLYVAHPDLVRQALTDDAFGQNDIMIRALAPLLGNGVLTAEGPAWAHQRRAATPAFRAESVATLVPSFAAAAGAACDRWLAWGERPFSIVDELMRATLEVILGALLPGAAPIDTARFGRLLGSYLGQSTWNLALSLLRAPRWTPYPGRARGRRTARELRAMVLGVLRHPATDRSAGLLRLLGAAGAGPALTDAELVDNVLTFVGAGHETTAVTLAWATYLLACHPDIEAQVVAEARAQPDGHAWDAQTLARLSLTKRVVQETMRMFPAAPMLVRMARRATSLGGFPVAPGTPIFLPIYALHRHRSAWVAPAEFDPDRFLPDQARARHRFAYLPFGAGPRVCMGATLATTEATIMLASIMRRVRLRLAPGCSPRPVSHVTLRPDPDIQMIACHRHGRA